MIDPLSFFYSRFRYRGAGAAEEERIVHLLRNLYGYKFTTPEQDRLSNNYRNLLAVYGKEDWSSRRWTTHFVSDIWSLFCMQAESLVQFGNIVHDPLMKAAKSRIEHHAFQNVQMKDIAVQFDLHPVQFTRRFQKVFGVSPSRYLFSIRMEKAKSLLIQTDYTLDHVAQLCGYDNGYYFSRMFTQYTKMNPSVFRKMHALPSI
jgi:AraC-like DNA-binding protein